MCVEQWLQIDLWDDELYIWGLSLGIKVAKTFSNLFKVECSIVGYSLVRG